LSPVDTLGRLTRLAPTPVLGVPGLPAGLADIVRECMAKRPEERPKAVDVSLQLWSVVHGDYAGSSSAGRSSVMSVASAGARMGVTTA
jgi:hypothetical protein